MISKMLALWQTCSAIPGGKYVFSKLLGFFVPYSGTLGAIVTELSPGHCKVSLRERRGVRNHLKSVHAMALANLGELASGLALLSWLPKGARGIVVSFKIDYLKKARGRLSAECTFPTLQSIEEITLEVPAQILNDQNEAVAHVTATWKIGKIKT